VIENLFKCLRDHKDQANFCKLLKIYFDGVLNLRDFVTLFNGRYLARLQPQVKDEIEKLLPTRNASRRGVSLLIKPWNDLDHQAFEKISPDSSYYRIDDRDGFPIPTCTAKELDPVFKANLNDRYLSLATGSEKAETRGATESVKNQYADRLYQNEDRLYEKDTQIDNIRKTYYRVCQVLEEFQAMTEGEQAVFKFPLERLSPLPQYWEHRWKKQIFD
jgi:histone deacetylase complex regulatory component SIN3